MTSEQQRIEYTKCARDPVYFMCTYCTIMTAKNGKQPFRLYDFQKDVIHHFLKHRECIVLKARQIGLTTISAAYATWRMLFMDDQSIVVIADNQKGACKFVRMIKLLYDYLPEWLQLPLVTDNKTSLAFSNYSNISAEPSVERAASGTSPSLLIWDEAGIIKPKLAEEIWTSAQSAYSSNNSDCIVLSTPRGIGNTFHKLWQGAVTGDNGFFPIKLPWQVHPEKTQAWRDYETKKKGELKAAQEYDCDFLTSGNTVISAKTIEWFNNCGNITDPIEKRHKEQLWLWKLPEEGQRYLISADVSRGDGSDYSAFHVINIDTMEQVAEFKGQCSTGEYANLLHATAIEYNTAHLVVENASIGWAVLQTLVEHNYPSLYYSKRKSDLTSSMSQRIQGELSSNKDSMVPGFTNSSKTRPLMIEKFESIFSERADGVTIHSIRLMQELQVFVWNTLGKAEAMNGYNDDLVMSLAIGLWVRESEIKKAEEGKRLYGKMLNSFKLGNNTQRTGGALTKNNATFVDPWIHNSKGIAWDLTELLKDGKK